MFLNWKVNKDWTEEAEFSYQGWVRNKGVVKDLWIGRQPGADIRMDGGKGVLGMQISFKEGKEQRLGGIRWFLVSQISRGYDIYVSYLHNGNWMYYHKEIYIIVDNINREYQIKWDDMGKHKDWKIEIDEGEYRFWYDNKDFNQWPYLAIYEDKKDPDPGPFQWQSTKNWNPELESFTWEGWPTVSGPAEEFWEGKNPSSSIQFSSEVVGTFPTITAFYLKFKNPTNIGGFAFSGENHVTDNYVEILYRNDPNDSWKTAKERGRVVNGRNKLKWDNVGKKKEWMFRFSVDYPEEHGFILINSAVMGNNWPILGIYENEPEPDPDPDPDPEEHKIYLPGPSLHSRLSFYDR